MQQSYDEIWRSVLEKLKNEYRDHENILIVSHGGFIKAIYFSLNGIQINL